MRYGRTCRSQCHDHVPSLIQSQVEPQQETPRDQRGPWAPSREQQEAEPKGKQFSVCKKNLFFTLACIYLFPNINLGIT